MIDVAEHVYHDDPQQGHPDVRTRLRDVRYFFIGNGLIQGVIQHAPSGEGTLYGLLLMDAQQLRMKREAVTLDSGQGLTATMLSVRMDGSQSALPHDHLDVRWNQASAIPCVRVQWHACNLDVTEDFYCADRSRARITREIHFRNKADSPCNFLLETGIGLRNVARRLQLPAGGGTAVSLRYDLDTSSSAVDFNFEENAPESHEAAKYWGDTAQVHLTMPAVDHLFHTAAWQLPSMISSRGRIDAGIWQYCREWVRDQSFVAHAALLSGHHAIARIMLDRLLTEFVSVDGSTVDSSEKRAPADAELDQNGTLLHVLREHALWTGDLTLVRAHWDRIVRVAEFPLGHVFREPVSGLMANQRDYWERHAVYGIQPGIELTYQVFVSLGLAAAAALARQVGSNDQAARWQAEAERIQHAVLHHPTHSLTGSNGFFKRLGANGRSQDFIAPAPASGLPREVGLARNIPHPLNPDSASVLPIVYGFVPADSHVARNTLGQMEELWNQGWKSGGYGRYHMDSDPDSPGAWPFPSLYIARAFVECGDHQKVRRVIDWLASLPESASGSFFEMYGRRIAPPYAQNGIVPWNWAEMIMLVIKNILGFQPDEDAMVVRPRLLPGMDRAHGSVRFRDCRISFEFSRDPGLQVCQFIVDSRRVDVSGEKLRIPFEGRDIRVEAKLPAH